MISVDETQAMIELVIGEPPATWSHFISPAQWAALNDQVEAMEPMREYRRKQSIAAAKEAHSHETRGAA